MTRRDVTFNTLWLLSERDAEARRIELPRSTLLLGPNGTGKSRVTKNIFWALGCEPLKRDVGNWDPGTLAALSFSFQQNDYLSLRVGPRLGLFHAGKLLFATKRRSEWDKRLANLFGFHLKMQRPSGPRFDQAGVEYLTLPFYMDQDGSWGPTWSTYKDLAQFKDWRKTTFSAFIGLRPNAYFQAKQLRDEVSVKLNDRRKELEAQRAAFRRVQDYLPQQVAALSLQGFRDELAQLAIAAKAAHQQQIELRAKLVATVNSREQTKSDLQLAVAAHQEIAADAVYLSEMPRGPIECPTCGTIHENSFHARLQLSEDSDTMAVLVGELRGRLDQISEEEASIRSDLESAGAMILELEFASKSKQADLQMTEFLSAHSVQTLHDTFDRVSASLRQEVSELEAEEADLAAELRKFDDRHRVKRVGDFYGATLADLSLRLNVPKDEDVTKAKIGERARVGGSSAPRSTLAVHLAMLKTNSEFGDWPQFPFVVDTPQQSGQDAKNLSRMIEVIGQQAGQEHQLILAIEALPPEADIGRYRVIEFNRSHGAMNKEQYADVVGALKGPYGALVEAIAAQESSDANKRRGSNRAG